MSGAAAEWAARARAAETEVERLRGRLETIEAADDSKVDDWLDEYADAAMEDIEGRALPNGSREYSDVPSERTNEARRWLMSAFRHRTERIERLRAALEEIRSLPWVTGSDAVDIARAALDKR